MKKFNIVVWLLLLSFILSACDGISVTDRSGDTNDTLTTEEENTSREIVLTSDGKAAFNIVIPEVCSEKISSAADALKKKLKEVTGAFFAVRDDYTRDDQVVDSEGEIIIGDCKRTDAKNALATLKFRDYALSANDNNIMLSGYEDSKISAAVYELIDILSEENLTVTNGKTVLKWAGNYVKSTFTYKFENMTLNGVHISEYQIVYPAGDESDLYEAYAQDIQKSIGRSCGSVLPIVSDATEAKTYEILIGKTNRAESAAFYSGAVATKSLEYGLRIQGEKILIAGGGYFSVGFAVDLFESEITGLKEPLLDGLDQSKKSMIKDLPARSGTYRIMSYNILADYEGWGASHVPVSSELRQEFVSGLIREYQPDVIALQEVTPTWCERLPSLIGDDYDFVYRKLTGGQANSCPLIYNKSKLTVVESGHINFWEGATAFLYQTVTWAVFEDKVTHERFAAFGTHWKTDDYLAKQLQEADDTANLIKSVQDEYNVPVFAMGDFNALPSSQAYNLFLSAGGLKNATASQAVDHIFCSKDLTVTAKGSENSGGFQFGSDHYPVWIDVNLE